MQSPKVCGAILARKLFDGTSVDYHENQVIEIEAGRISCVRNMTEGEDTSLPSAPIIAPGFIDLQINGAADVQFNFSPTQEAVASIAYGARQGGTAHLLPTFITAPGQDYLRAIEATRTALENGVPGVLGVHLEGPFLSPDRPGIHPAAAIRPLDEADLAALTVPFPGVLLVTLAPECQPKGALKRLSGAGVILSVGHSAASASQVRIAEAEGLRMATHLFNAMPSISGREPGVCGAVMTSEKLFAGIIADGVHVDWSNVRLAVSAMGARLCVVTDAMMTLEGATQSFDLFGQTIHRSDGRLSNAAGRLAGAHVAMDESVRNLVRNAGVPLAQALAMASGNPSKSLRLEGDLGCIAPGYRASLTCLDDKLSSCGVVVDGLFYQREIAS